MSLSYRDYKYKSYRDVIIRSTSQGILALLCEALPGFICLVRGGVLISAFEVLCQVGRSRVCFLGVWNVGRSKVGICGVLHLHGRYIGNGYFMKRRPSVEGWDGFLQNGRAFGALCGRGTCRRDLMQESPFLCRLLCHLNKFTSSKKGMEAEDEMWGHGMVGISLAGVRRGVGIAGDFVVRPQSCVFSIFSNFSSRLPVSRPYDGGLRRLSLTLCGLSRSDHVYRSFFTSCGLGSVVVSQNIGCSLYSRSLKGRLQGLLLGNRGAEQRI